MTGSEAPLRRTRRSGISSRWVCRGRVRYCRGALLTDNGDGLMTADPPCWTLRLLLVAGLLSALAFAHLDDASRKRRSQGQFGWFHQRAKASRPRDRRRLSVSTANMCSSSSDDDVDARINRQRGAVNESAGRVATRHSRHRPNTGDERRQLSVTQSGVDKSVTQSSASEHTPEGCAA